MGISFWSSAMMTPQQVWRRKIKTYMRIWQCRCILYAAIIVHIRSHVNILYICNDRLVFSNAWYWHHRRYMPQVPYLSQNGKIYRKPLYLMIRTMVSCIYRVSLKQIHWYHESMEPSRPLKVPLWIFLRSSVGSIDIVWNMVTFWNFHLIPFCNLT